MFYVVCICDRQWEKGAGAMYCHFRKLCLNFVHFKLVYVRFPMDGHVYHTLTYTYITIMGVTGQS